MRVEQCCCGCSLRTGTLILLWFFLLNHAALLSRLAVAACSSKNKLTFVDSATMGWSSIVLVIAVYGIFGVEKHRPSYLLPFMGAIVVTLVKLVFMIFILWIGPATKRDDFTDAFKNRSPATSCLDRNTVHQGFNDVVFALIIIMIIIATSGFYYLSVVYSYYKQMQEEDKEIYSPPTGTGTVK